MKINYQYLTFALVIILLLLIFGWLVWGCYFPSIAQRKWPVPKIEPNKEFIVFLQDKIMDSGKQFLINLPTVTDFPSVFSTKEREIVRQEAHEFFQKQFGLSNAFLKVFMYEITINPDAGYNVYHVQSNPGQKYKLIDGGFTAYIPAHKKLYGRYGGKSGVAGTIQGVLAYGYYIWGNDEYRVRYKGMCPLSTMVTYDGNYTFIDCDVEIVKAPNPSLVGLKGKAIGIYKVNKLSNGLDHLVIRNVLTIS